MILRFVLRLACIAALWIQPAGAIAEQTVDPALLAESAFTQGLELLESDENASRTAFDNAITQYTSIITNSEEPLPRVLYNRGNAHLLKGDLAQAIADYRTALVYAPNHAHTLANLNTARSRVATRVEASSEPASTPIDLARSVPIEVRAGLLVLSWILLCALLTIRVLNVTPSVRVPAGILAAIVLISGAMTATDLLRSKESIAIVQTSTFARTGPSNTAYGKAFKEALAPGVEGRIIDDSRAGWLAIELLDDRTAWVTSDAVIRLDLMTK